MPKKSRKQRKVAKEKKVTLGILTKVKQRRKSSKTPKNQQYSIIGYTSAGKPIKRLFKGLFG